jgi:hypothetical protein
LPVAEWVAKKVVKRGDESADTADEPTFQLTYTQA